MHGYFVLGLAIAALVFSTTSASAEPGGIPQSRDAHLESGSALPLVLVRSRQELEAYLALGDDKDSPLAALSPDSRKAFLDSLTFSPAGLTSFRVDTLSRLNASEAYRVLALFGAQHMLASVPLHGTEEDTLRPPLFKSFAEQVSQLQAEETEWPALVDAIVSAYRTQFDRFQSGPGNETAEADLEARFLATWMTAFYAVNTTSSDLDWLLDELWLLLEALDTRGLAGAEHYRRAHQVAIQARRFDLAARLSDAHPQAFLEPLPSIHAEGAPESGPRVWRYREQSQQLVLEAAALAQGPALLVVAIPNCGPARRAAAHIVDDPELRPLFERYAHWLVLPSRALDLPAQQQWEAQYPQFPLAHIHRAEDWPFLDDLSQSPVFYAIDGERRQVGKVVGWPHEGRRDELLALLRSAGIAAQIAAD
jgi:hypothetical protein